MTATAVPAPKRVYRSFQTLSGSLPHPLGEKSYFLILPGFFLLSVLLAITSSEISLRDLLRIANCALSSNLTRLQLQRHLLN